MITESVCPLRATKGPTMKKRWIAPIAAASVLLWANPAAAQASRGTVDLSQPSVLADNVFILVCAIFVIFMQAGFAMVEAGLTRAKNAAHMMLKNLLDFVVGAAGFALVGYHIAFSGAAYLGFNWLWAGTDTVAPYSDTLSLPIHFLFQMAFAAATATIISGAVAERVQFRAYFVYSAALSAVIYPVVVSWVFAGDGWLNTRGFVDLAGGSVVHVVGGTAAVIGAVILGPRIGRFDEDGRSNPIPGHNVPLAVLGVFILLVSWFAFNAGSVGRADISIGAVAVATAMGGAFGGLGGTISSWLTLKTPDVTLIGNGLLGGLVSVTAGAANVGIFSAMIMGLIGGFIATNGVFLLDRLKVDDPVGAIPVHLMCGVWGTLAVGIFADPDVAIDGSGPAGLIYGGGSLLVDQAVGLLAIIGFVGVASLAMFLVLREFGWLRVSVEHEMVGLDLAEHALPAYNDDFVDYDDALIGIDELDSYYDDEFAG